MSNRAQAYGMIVMAALMVAALFVNIDLRDTGQQYRPLQILVCGPLAIWCAFKAVMLWSKQ